MKNEVAICVVGDFRFLRRHFKNLFSELTENGKYSGEVVILTSKITPVLLIKGIRKNKKVIVIRQKKIRFSKSTKNSFLNLNTNGQPNRFKTKNFQWHKLHLFDEDMKRWKYIFYLDLNMHIHFDINQVLNLTPKNKLYARADGYPDYNNSLSSQFDSKMQKHNELNNKYDLSIKNYFQTGVLYFDTDIIEKDTKQNLISLAEDYPISITNEQGIMNLYFIFIKKQYKELPTKVNNFITYYYWLVKEERIIITKQLTEKYK